MKDLVFNTPSAVWLILMAATGLQWWLGMHGLGASVQMATISLFVIAFFKVRLVIMHFMEIGTAPLPLRLIMEGWVFGVCGILIALYLLLGSGVVA